MTTESNASSSRKPAEEPTLGATMTTESAISKPIEEVSLRISTTETGIIPSGDKQEAGAPTEPISLASPFLDGTQSIMTSSIHIDANQSVTEEATVVDSDTSTILPEDEIDDDATGSLSTSTTNTAVAESQPIALQQSSRNTVVPAVAAKSPFSKASTPAAPGISPGPSLFRSALLQISRKPPGPILPAAPPAPVVTVSTIPPRVPTPDKLEIRKRRFGGMVTETQSEEDEPSGAVDSKRHRWGQRGRGESGGVQHRGGGRRHFRS
jgi:hypothetical protein